MIPAKTKPSLHYSAFACFMLLFVQNIIAQERPILKGQVIVDSIQNASGVHVINLNAETGTTTGKNGEFRIPAKKGDTIFFSSVQFEHKNLVIKNSDFKVSIKVRLIEKFNELDEIRLDDIKLSGILSEDITRMPKSIYEKLGWSFPKPRKTSLELAVQSATGNGPLITIMNTLNGKIKELEKAEENNEISILVNKGLNLVGESFFMLQLNLPETEIINFLFFCSEDPLYAELVRAESTLKLVEFFHAKTDSFKELRELD